MAICGKCHREAPDGALFCSFCGTTIRPATAEGEAVDPLIGQTISGKYFVHQLLGRGGMGEVYKATHLTLDRPVVLKLLKKSFLSDPSIVQRFHREARAASRLNHPNSITIIDFGQTEDGTLFMAMEYLSGRSLSRVIAEDQPIPETRVVHIASQILAALAEAHALGIIHRDLKPENVMLESRRDEADFVKVLDFGIAKLNEPGDGAGRLTQAGIVCGTPGYMSPEQVRGDELDARSDLYSVGIILYEMLTGRLPFDADTPMGLVTKHLVEAPPPLGVRKPGLHVSPGLEGLVLRCLAKDRTERPATAEEMRAALLAWVAQGEHAVRPTPAPAPSRTVLIDAASVAPEPRGETGSVKVWRAPTGAASVPPSATRGAAPPTPAPQAQAPRTPAPFQTPRTPPPTTVMPTPPPSASMPVAPAGGGTVVMAPPPQAAARAPVRPTPPPTTVMPTPPPSAGVPPPTTMMPTPAPVRAPTRPAPAAPPAARPATGPRPAQRTPAHGKTAAHAPPRHEMDEVEEEAPPPAPPPAKSKLPIVAGAGAGAVVIAALVAWGVMRKPAEPAPALKPVPVATAPAPAPPPAAQPAAPAPAPKGPPPTEVARKPEPAPVEPVRRAEPSPAPPSEEPARRPAPRVATAAPLPRKAPSKGVRAVRAAINSIATPPAASGDGVLTVTATPWANVFVDGAALGETPKELLLGTGTYRVRAVHPTMGTREETVTILAGKRRVLNVTFAN